LSVISPDRSRPRSDRAQQRVEWSCSETASEQGTDLKSRCGYKGWGSNRPGSVDWAEALCGVFKKFLENLYTFKTIG
jgi:hypothetical protein